MPLKREGRTSALAGATADELRRGAVAVELGTEREDALGARVLTLEGKLDPSREQLVVRGPRGHPGHPVSGAPIFGGAVTVALTCLLGVRTALLHAAMIVAYTLVLA